MIFKHGENKMKNCSKKLFQKLKTCYKEQDYDSVLQIEYELLQISLKQSARSDIKLCTDPLILFSGTHNHPSEIRSLVGIPKDILNKSNAAMRFIAETKRLK